MNKFESGPKPEGQEQPVEERELTPELKEAVEGIAEKTGDLTIAETELINNIPEGKLIELRKSGKLMKFFRATALITMLMGFGGMVNKAEAGSWKTRQRQTAGDVLKDVGIQVGGTILREKMERDYEKKQERIRELENEIPALQDELEKKEIELQNFAAQEAAGADMSDLKAGHIREIERLRIEIEQKIAELEKLEKGSVLRELAREGVRRATRGGGSWRVNR